MTTANQKNGFTLIEIIVSLSLFALVIILVSSIFITAQRSYNKNAAQAELSQNVRVALDRLSRELRQAENIITALPPAEDDPLNPPAELIFFQDGHDDSRITYLKYYLNGTNLKRERKAYYFPDEPSVYVAYSAVGPGGELPQEEIIEDYVVGEYFNGLEFWGSNGLININFNLLKNQNSAVIESSIYNRNH